MATLKDIQLPFGAANGVQSDYCPLERGMNPTVANLDIGELFAGAGGMALGASLAEYSGVRFQHVWATDNNKDACETFKQNIKVDKNLLFERMLKT